MAFSTNTVSFYDYFQLREFPEANMTGIPLSTTRKPFLPLGICIHPFKKKANLFLNLKREDETRQQSIIICNLSCLEYLVQSPLYLFSLTSKSQATSFSMIPPCWNNVITIVLKRKRKGGREEEEREGGN